MRYRKNPDSDIDFTWYRHSGAFHSVDAEGQCITGVSAQTWRDYIKQIDKLPRETTGRVISPELISITDILLKDVPKRQQEINQRLSQLCEISTDLPQAQLVVGTPEFTDDRNLPYNSLLSITNGLCTRLSRKWMLTQHEHDVFRSTDKLPVAGFYDRTLSVICADLVSIISQTPKNIKQVQVSACWATPGFNSPGHQPPPDEERYKGAMIYAIQQLIGKSAVESVVVIDRTLPTTDIAPLNCVARKILPEE